ncbi:MAG: hypothetical protein PUB22_10600, partial [Clostridiales bacterium]|nr:hypothetical protein [Clostridiales bacterium]
SAEQTTYTHTYGPSNGETYYYGVQAYRSCSVFGEIYNQDDAEGYPVTAAGTPVTPSLNNAKAEGLSSAIQVSWEVKKGTPRGYYIYRNENGGGYTRVATISNSSVLKWKDTTIKKGIYYQYKIKPYVENSNEKVFFGKAVSTGTAKATGTLSKVKGVSIRKNGKYITVSWKKNSLAVGYKVYRKKGKGSFKLVKTVTSNCYNDKNVFKGKSYTYKIKAYYDNYKYDSRRKKYYRDSIVTSEYSQQVSMKRQ